MTGIARVILFAKDMTKMVAFYRDVVRLEPVTSHDPAWHEFECDGTFFALHGIPDEYAKEIVSESPPQAREATPMKVCFRAANVEEKRVALKAAGVEVRDLHQFDEFVFFDAIDPEGNVVQFTNR